MRKISFLIVVKGKRCNNAEKHTNCFCDTLYCLSKVLNYWITNSIMQTNIHKLVIGENDSIQILEIIFIIQCKKDRGPWGFQKVFLSNHFQYEMSVHNVSNIFCSFTHFILNKMKTRHRLLALVVFLLIGFGIGAYFITG